jgi:hypothetical protein
VFPGANAPGTERFAVRIRLDDAEKLRLPAGTQGGAAVYTGDVHIAGVIRMALMRNSSWSNYLFSAPSQPEPMLVSTNMEMGSTAVVTTDQL